MSKASLGLLSGTRTTLRRWATASAARIDYIRMSKRFSWFQELIQRSHAHRAELGVPYHHYVSHVSSPEMALSLPTSAFALTLCHVIRPKRILDLGSGFSSLVFRLYAPNGYRPYVLSVDDDERWLDRTSQFLKAQGAPADGLVTWDEFTEKKEPGFDVILHDLGQMDLRARALPTVLSLTAHKGFVIVDDVHKRPYRVAVYRELANHGQRGYSLYSVTADEFGRYAMLVAGS